MITTVERVSLLLPVAAVMVMGGAGMVPVSAVERVSSFVFVFKATVRATSASSSLSITVTVSVTVPVFN